MKIIIETLLQMSATASVAVLAVLIARLFMRGCPKKYSYILWSIVGLRLCIPFSFESRLSIFNLFAKAETDTAAEALAPVGEVVVQKGYDLYSIIGALWLTGILVFAVYGIFTYYRLQHKFSVSFPMGDGVYGVEGLASPFVMGFLNPKIYIPMGLDSDTESYVLMHERTHLKRGDHIIKLFAFVLLCVHWFNPFCWLAFVFMSRDMEMSCDERVLGIGDISADYSSALLSFAQNKRFPSPGPLCFGEVSVKRRIKNILNHKKPALYITVISVLLCVTVFVVCGADPKDRDTEPQPEVSVETHGDAANTTMADSISDDTTSVDTTTAVTTAVATVDTTADTTTSDTVAVDTTTAATTTAHVYIPEDTTTAYTPAVTEPPAEESDSPVRERVENEEDRPDTETRQKYVFAIPVHP